MVDLAAAGTLPAEALHGGGDEVCVICALDALGYTNLAGRVAYAKHSLGL